MVNLSELTTFSDSCILETHVSRGIIIVLISRKSVTIVPLVTANLVQYSPAPVIMKAGSPVVASNEGTAMCVSMTTRSL